MAVGFLKFHRSMIDHPVVGIGNPKRFAAWCWMLAEAAFQERDVEVRGRVITLRRGQICHSVRFMAQAWGWDKAAVSRFIDRLKTETMIEADTETGQLVITICNYEKFQGEASSCETQNETPNETPARQQRDSSETNYKKERIKEESSVAIATDVEDSEATRDRDIRADLFNRGVAYLGRHGTNERNARSFIGKTLKTHSDEEVLAAFSACSEERPVDPIPWINTFLKNRRTGGRNGTTSRQDDFREIFAAAVKGTT